MPASAGQKRARTLVEPKLKNKTAVDFEVYIGEDLNQSTMLYDHDQKLSIDDTIPKYATNIVFLTSSTSQRKIEKTILDSIFNTGSPKRADIYWFVHVNVTNEPYGLNYDVDTVVKNDVYFIQFNLGFRIEPRIDFYFRQVVTEMVEKNEVDISDRKEFNYQNNSFGDFKFIVRDSFLSFDNNMPFWKNFVMKSFYNLKYFSVKEDVNFGLDQSNLVVEKYPLVVIPYNGRKLERK